MRSQFLVQEIPDLKLIILNTENLLIFDRCVELHRRIMNHANQRNCIKIHFSIVFFAPTRWIYRIHNVHCIIYNDTLSQKLTKTIHSNIRCSRYFSWNGLLFKCLLLKTFFFEHNLSARTYILAEVAERRNKQFNKLLLLKWSLLCVFKCLAGVWVLS